MKTLIEIFDINKGDIVSIVGTGGKTTLLYQLGKELRNEYRVLLTTSTKIIKPSFGNYDSIYTCMEDYISDKIEKKNGITILSKGVNDDDNKLLGIDDEDLELVIDDYDVVVIEADGSRNLPLKGWKKHEPPILLRTNKTIGIFPINMVGEMASEDKIYGYKEFKNFLGNKDIIDHEVVGKICTEKNGIFKNSRGKLYFYINNADSDEDLNKAFKLAEYLKNIASGVNFDFKICIGSLKKGVFYEY